MKSILLCLLYILGPTIALHGVFFEVWALLPIGVVLFGVGCVLDEFFKL